MGGVSPARLPEPVPPTILSAQVLPQLHVILGAGAGADPKHSLCASHILSISRLSVWRMYHLTLCAAPYSGKPRGPAPSPIPRMGWASPKEVFALPGGKRRKR